MSINRVSLSALFTVALLAALITAQSTVVTGPTASSTTATVLPLHYFSRTDRLIIGFCVSFGVLFIVIASYFCCCHSACRTARKGSVPRSWDAENGREGWQRHDAGAPEPTKRTSTSKNDTGMSDAHSTTTEAPPRYDEI
ncbi:hypothetical protein MVEN_00492500 [Mycena venus]|uniref:Uncharacterized protein n=1 Tax=Mycena venus TaxID=2733690 RepID=A0A8H6YXK7_9AGAR|nr:hypothetical protein MVEN_00492500 [Mycena venus]